MKRQLTIGFASLAMGLGSATAAQLCEEDALNPTPTERFIVQGEVVTDRVTGLMWQRCAIGQLWDGKICQEDRKPQVRSWFNWADAQAQILRLQGKPGYEGWRLPTVQELRTLIDRHCQDPSMNLEVFPNAPAWYFWTSSEYLDNPDYAWQIDFKTGEINAHLKTSFSYYLRLVKGSQLATSKPKKQLTPEQQQERALARWDDGVHDLGNPDLATLEHAEDATEGFPRDNDQRVDWAKVLLDGQIQPRASRTEEGAEMVVWDQDIILKDTASMPYVRFPHKLHSMWLACENCHEEIFPSRSGEVDISMETIYKGEHCGVCHGKVAFTPNACERCHSILHEGSPTKWW